MVAAPTAPPPPAETSAEAEDKISKLLSQKLDIHSRFALSLETMKPIILPTSSTWFDQNKIHDIEIEALPEFFDGHPTKTPNFYKTLRNAIISFFYEKPKNYLPICSCINRFGGDTCSLIRIHAFLEHWGLINFSFDLKNHNLYDSTPINNNANFQIERNLISEKQRPSTFGDPPSLVSRRREK